MGESVIVNSPMLLMGVLVVILLTIFEQRTHSSGFILPVISMGISLFVVFSAFLYGAAWEEVIVLVLTFLVINMFGYKDVGGEE